jgi:enhancer of polycomb-like protein
MRPDGRSADADLILLADKRAEKENEFRHDIEVKVANHRKWNQNHIDLTRGPLSPIKEQGTELKFRPAKTQYLMTPPASTSEDMDLDQEQEPEAMAIDKPNPPIFQFEAGGAGRHSDAHPPAFRRRIGRLNRLWIDRRGLQTPPRKGDCGHGDRWAYDSDSDSDEPQVHEVDPFDMRALKFRASIPLNPYFFRKPAPVLDPNRALPASQQQQPQQQASHPLSQQQYQQQAAAAAAAAAAMQAQQAQQTQQPQQAQQPQKAQQSQTQAQVAQ